MFSYRDHGDQSLLYKLPVSEARPFVRGSYNISYSHAKLDSGRFWVIPVLTRVLTRVLTARPTT